MGVDKDLIIKKFTTQLPVRFQLASGDIQLNGVVLEVDNDGKALGIRRIQTIMESY